MITSSLSFECPFNLRDLVWCQLTFATNDVQQLSYDDPIWGAVKTELPADMYQSVPKRRTEFLAGRLCAAYALRQLGHSELVGRKNRAPVWPDGVLGSITHSHQRAITVVSLHTALLGVDCERVMPHERAQKLRPSILSETENELRPSALSQAAFVTLVFSAKEAFYKAIFPDIGRILDFQDADLCVFSDRTMHLLFEGKMYCIWWQLRGDECLTLCCGQAPRQY